MISLQTSKEILPSSEEISLSKKRKWDDPSPDHDHHKIKTIKPASVFDSNFKNQSYQFPLEWQRCLDIKSGQIYFYNTKTQKRALGDPCSNLETYNNPAPMSLELELNLPCTTTSTTSIYSNNDFTNSKEDGRVLTRRPSWLSFDQGEQQEMVTAVCRKCYMLVMMCKSSPSCPNCKFMHPISAPLFNQQDE